MPIDANTALADLDRLIENLGVQKDNGDPSRKSTLQIVQDSCDFGRFGRGLDSQEGLLSNNNGLSNKTNSKFGQFGQQKSENEHIERHPNSVDDEKKQRDELRARVEKKINVQTVQLSKNDQSAQQNNNLEFGQSLDSRAVTVQNPPRLQDVDARTSLPDVVIAVLGSLCPDDPDCPPGDVPPRRWAQFLADVRAFVASGFATQAAALGWTMTDLYGCDDECPFARIDKAGLLWLLNGERLVAISNDAAAIETRSGARQTYRRRR